MNDDLQSTLRGLIESGSQSNPAMNALINDYAKYHVVLVVPGGILVLTFALLSVVFLTRFKRAPKIGERTWVFEKKMHLSFGILSIFVALLLALIVAANATNALDPRHGFSLLVDSFASPKGGTYDVELRQAFNEWVKSGSNTIPPIVEMQIHDRIVFHATKAIVSGILLVVFVVLGVLFWSGLIERSRASASKWKLKEIPFLVSGIAAVTLALLMMVFVVANMQGAFAPISLTIMNLYN